MRERLEGPRAEPAPERLAAPARRPPTDLARLAPLIGNRALGRLVRARRLLRTRLTTKADDLDTADQAFDKRTEEIAATDIASGHERLSNLVAALQEHGSATAEADVRARAHLDSLLRQLNWERGSDPRGTRGESSLKSYPPPRFGATEEPYSGAPMRDYDFLDWIYEQHAQASYGTQVARARHRPSGALMAIKILSKEFMTAKEAEAGELEADREMYAIRREIRHHRLATGGTGVLPLIAVVEDRFNVYIVMPLAVGGDVEHFIAAQQSKRLTEAQAAPIFRQMVEALGHLHAQGTTHLDVKARNIVLMDPAGTQARLMDFGGSREGARLDYYPYYGTDVYMAPEIEAASDDYSPVKLKEGRLKKADVYSLAVTMIEMLTGKESAKVPGGISPDLADLLHQMLARKPKDRLDIAGVKAHPWWTAVHAGVH